jgi:hypothetical protein
LWPILYSPLASGEQQSNNGCEPKYPLTKTKRVRLFTLL